MADFVDNWKTQMFRQSVVLALEKVIQRSGLQVARSSSEMENHVFMKAKTQEEYMNMVAKLIIHVREMSQVKHQGSNQNQGPQVIMQDTTDLQSQIEDLSIN